MRVRFDQETDALYIRLDESAVSGTEEVSPGVMLDFDAENRVVGIEILDVKRRLPEAQLKQIQFEVA
jgi:uncharacterized protein YuzE